MKKIILFLLLLTARGAFGQLQPYNLNFNVTVAGTLTVGGVNLGAAVSSNTTAIALAAPIANPNFTGGLGLSGNLSKAAVFNTTGFGLNVAPATYTSTTSSGTTTFQGTNTFGAPTLAASSPTILTNASTVYIDNVPIAGTNVTIGTAYALYIQNGQSFFGGFANYGGGFGTTGSSSSANFFVAGGSSSGSTSSTLVQFGGSSAINYRALFGGSSISTLTVGNSYANVAIGSSPMSKAASGTNGWLVNALVNSLGTISGSGSTITNTAALWVGAASTAGTNNYSLFVNGLTSTQGLRLTYNAQTANYTVLYTDYYIDCTANSFTITLPLSAAGQEYVITNSGAGTITVQGTSSQLVNGSASITIAAGISNTIYGTGTAWRVKS